MKKYLLTFIIIFLFYGQTNAQVENSKFPICYLYQNNINNSKILYINKNNIIFNYLFKNLNNLDDSKPLNNTNNLITIKNTKIYDEIYNIEECNNIKLKYNELTFSNLTIQDNLILLLNFIYKYIIFLIIPFIIYSYWFYSKRKQFAYILLFLLNICFIILNYIYATTGFYKVFEYSPIIAYSYIMYSVYKSKMKNTQKITSVITLSIIISLLIFNLYF